MKLIVPAALALLGCGATQSTERYGFVARLGQDTVSVENVTRRGNIVTSDAVDRFPRVRRRHTEIELGSDGGIRHLVMDIHTPSEPAGQRERRVVADVTRDSVRVTKEDKAGRILKAWATQGGTAMAHVPQMYSLYELYFAAALKRAAQRGGAATDTVQMRQFYIDREFDRFPLHGGIVRLLADGKAEITHDWLAGTGEATLDSAYRLQRYSGARTTYKVDVQRLTDPPDIGPIAERFESSEAKGGGRPLLGDVIPYDQVWRTGANAATQFTTSAPITLAGMAVPAGTYTLWTVPRRDRVELIVNRQTGQWGTGYGRAHDIGRAPMTTETLAAPVEQFTISVDPGAASRGTLTMAWGPFKWTAPIQVQ
jgi:hypothetical protein